MGEHKQQSPAAEASPNMAEYSPDELQAPAWLDDLFFANILQSAENDPTITVLDSGKLQPATKPGDNFCSIMFRTTVRYTTKSQAEDQLINLIIKATPTAEGFKKNMTKDNTLFLKEINMYTEVLPAMSKLLKDVGEHFEFPRLIHASTQPNTVIVLEDLSPRGWLPGRVCIESLEEACYSIKNIAKFHATSLYLQQTTMDLSSNSTKQLMTSGQVLAIFTKGFEELCNSIETWQDCEVFAKKLKPFCSSIKERLEQVYNPNPPSVGYNVLNHGDFHWKNLMHRRNQDGRIVDTMMVDYQCCHWGSPAIDILYLIDLIVDNRTKTAHRNELIYEYHQHFKAILNKIGFLGEIPTLVDLQIELLRKGFLEFIHVSVFEQFKHIEISGSTFDELGDGKLSTPCLNDHNFRDIIRSELCSLMCKGLLDE